MLLENLELEYETIANQDMASEVCGVYSAGRSLSYEHATLMKTSEWDKAVTLVNENINLPRKSMKAIVLLFTKKTGRVGSEEYVYPNIEKVKVTIEGNPNMHGVLPRYPQESLSDCSTKWRTMICSSLSKASTKIVSLSSST